MGRTTGKGCCNSALLTKWDQHNHILCIAVLKCKSLRVWRFLPWRQCWKFVGPSAANHWGRTTVDPEDCRPSCQGSEGQSPPQTQHRKHPCTNAAPFSWRRSPNPSAVPAAQTEKLSAGQREECEGRNLTFNKVASQNPTGGNYCEHSPAGISQFQMKTLVP